MLKGELNHNPSDDFDDTKVYNIEVDDFKLTVWNSSNRQKFDHKEVLSKISDEIEEGQMNGSVFGGGFNEIMFEIIEK